MPLPQGDDPERHHQDEVQEGTETDSPPHTDLLRSVAELDWQPSLTEGAADRIIRSGRWSVASGRDRLDGLRAVEAHEAMFDGRREVAAGILDERIAQVSPSWSRSQIGRHRPGHVFPDEAGRSASSYCVSTRRPAKLRAPAVNRRPQAFSYGVGSGYVPPKMSL